jgi:hypothetical protein
MYNKERKIAQYKYDTGRKYQPLQQSINHGINPVSQYLCSFYFFARIWDRRKKNDFRIQLHFRQQFLFETDKTKKIFTNHCLISWLKKDFLPI